MGWLPLYTDSADGNVVSGSPVLKKTDRGGSVKRILHVVESTGAGVLTFLVDLTNELVHDYEIYIAYAVRPETPSNLSELFDPRVRLIQVEHLQREIELEKEFKVVFEIRRIVRQVQPDLIHLHSSKAGVLGRWALNGRRIPLFYTPHGYSFLMKDQRPIKRMLYKAVEWISAKGSCTTISCSKSEHMETLKLTSKAECVNNGVNIKKLNESIASIKVEKDGAFTVFTLGRIAYQKNPGLFNEIALAMPDVQFLWIGDGELRDLLTAPNIRITGWLDREEALKYAVSADAFLLTSLWEGLSISLLEAMYLKKPCIVSNVDGNRAVVRHGENGFVCTGVPEFATAIREIREGRANRYVLTAYDEILSEYNTSVMSNRYRKIYETVE